MLDPTDPLSSSAAKPDSPQLRTQPEASKRDFAVSRSFTRNSKTGP